MCYLCLLKYSGVKFNYIVYDNGANSILGLLGGNVDCLCHVTMQPYKVAER